MSHLSRFLHNPSLIIIGAAETISGIGDWITMMAVYALLIFRGHGDAANSSAIFLAGLLPTLLASPIAGWLCDRFDRKRLMIISQILSGLAVSGLIFTRKMDLIYVLLALEALFLSFMAPARHASLPQIVGQAELTKANAFLQQLASLVKTGAPIAAGFILGIMDAHTAIVLDVLSFALAAFILTRLPALPAPARAHQPSENREYSSFKRKISSFVGVFNEVPQLRLLFFSIFMVIFVIVGFDVLAPLFLRDNLGANEQFFGLVIGLIGLGAVGGALSLMLRRNSSTPWRDLNVGIFLLVAIPLTIVAASMMKDQNSARLLLLAGCLVGGFGTGLVHVQAVTLMQTLAPASRLGQVSGMLQSVMIAGQLLGIAASPLLVPAVFSIPFFFAISTAAILALVLILTVQSPRFNPGTLIQDENPDMR